MLKKAIVLGMMLLSLGLATKEALAFEMLENFFDKLNLGYEDGAIIGLGARFATRPYEDVDASVIPVPMINAQYKRFFVEGSTIGAYLNKDEHFKLAVVGAPRFWGYKPDDSNALVGMTKRGWSFDAGLRGTLKQEWFDSELTFLNDVSGEHGGQEVDLFIKRQFLEGALTPRVGVKWLSSDLVDHYFGVRPTEARPGRPEYEPDSTANFTAGATMALPLGEKWAWVTDGAVQVLSEEITDSPIVEDGAILTVVTGFVYRY